MPPYHLMFVGGYHSWRDSTFFNTITFETINLKSSTYRKETAGNTILHYKIHHPRLTLKSISVGELTRAKRNCSSQEDYFCEANKICNRLMVRGYPPWVLTRAKNFVACKSRSDLLTSSPRTIFFQISQPWFLSLIISFMLSKIL